MKYILMMYAPKAGFETYRAWSEKDVQAHFAVLRAIGKDLAECGEFVATEGLAWPEQAKLVRTGHRRRVSRIEGVSRRLLDRGCRES